MCLPVQQQRTCKQQNRASHMPKITDVCITSLGRSSIVQIIELSAAPIASETRLKLLEEIDGGSPCSLASHARLRIDSFEAKDCSTISASSSAASVPFFSSATSVLMLSMNAATPPPGRSSSIDMQAFRRDHWPRGGSEIR